MAQINQNFTKFKGDDFAINFTIEDVGDAEGFDASWKLDSTPQVVKTTAVDGGITIEGNVVTVTLEKDDTVGLDDGVYTHELQLLDSDEGGVVAHGTFDLRMPLHDRS